MSRPCSRASSSAGFTVLELLVASSLGLLVVALSLTTLTTNRRIYKEDVVRTKINQNIRSAVDIIGMNIRQAGEALPDYFPAITLTNGTNDELTIRRNLYENEVFNLCQNLTAGTTTTNFIVAYNTTVSGCVYSSAYVTFFNTWNSYRTAEGGTVPGYIYDRSNRRGEFFNFTGGSTGSNQVRLNRNSAAWSYSYTGNGTTAALYLLEEFRFRLNNGLLQLIKNGDTSAPLNIVDQISSFQVSFVMSDGSVETAFAASDDWTDIRRVDVTLTGSDTFAGSSVTSTDTVQLFPRNILSH